MLKTKKHRALYRQRPLKYKPCIEYTLRSPLDEVRVSSVTHQHKQRLMKKRLCKVRGMRCECDELKTKEHRALCKQSPLETRLYIVYTLKSPWDEVRVWCIEPEGTPTGGVERA